MGVTGGHAIIRLTEGEQVQIVGVHLTDGHAADITRHAPAAVAGYGRGAYAWQDANHQVHVVKLATGEEQAISLPPLPYIDLVRGGIRMDDHVVESPLIDKPPLRAVPADYKWVGPNPARPEIAVPENWIVEQIPGGSSNGVSATDPRDRDARVVLVDGGCGVCYDPGINSPQIFQSFNSPLVGMATEGTYTWLDEQTVRFTLPPDKNSPYPTYGVTRTFPFANRGGHQDARVSVPEKDRETATIILDSLLSRP